MNTIKKMTFTITLLTVTANYIQAQVFDEWEARPNISLKYKVNSNFSVGGTYYLYLDNNLTHYNKSVIAGEAAYKLTSWLKAGFEYRRGMSPDKEHYNDLRYSFVFDHSLSQKWKIKYRPMLQQKFVSLDKEQLTLNPMEYYLRNRVTLEYKITKSTELYAFTENYQEIDQGQWSFYRQKSALGLDFGLSKHNSLGARFEVLNKRKGKMIARPNISYTFTFGRVDKKHQ